MKIISRIWQVGNYWVSAPPDDIFVDNRNRISCCGFVIWRGGALQKFGAAVKTRDMLHKCLQELRDHISTEYGGIRPESEWRYRVCSMQVGMRIDADMVENVIAKLRNQYAANVYYKPHTGLYAHRIVLSDDLGTMLLYDSGAVTLFTKDYNRAQYVCDIICGM